MITAEHIMVGLVFADTDTRCCLVQDTVAIARRLLLLVMINKSLLPLQLVGGQPRPAMLTVAAEVALLHLHV